MNRTLPTKVSSSKKKSPVAPMRQDERDPQNRGASPLKEGDIVYERDDNAKLKPAKILSIQKRSCTLYFCDPSVNEKRTGVSLTSVWKEKTFKDALVGRSTEEKSSRCNESEVFSA
jgi:hypothetical protein